MAKDLPIGAFFLRFFPHLRKDLKIAHNKMTPLQFMNRAIGNGLKNSLALTAFSFFIVSKAQKSLLLLIPIFLFFVLFFIFLEMMKVRSAIARRKKEIDQEVIFVGRYLLIKLYSGRPLLNALAETSKSRGVTAAYVREIVHDINTGTPIETALKNAIEYSPSEKFSKILFYLNNALKIGVDVTKPLSSILDELTVQEELEVKKYGKKLNTLVIFYMVAAVVLPSLGISLFMVMANFVNFSIGIRGLLVITLFIGILQFIFISLFRSIRPMVEL
jgi:archaeal flagellar protein FlaJ